MNKYQLTKFKVNENIAAEISDLNLELSAKIKTVNYPSVMFMISENKLRGFEEFKVTQLTANHVHDNSDYPARLVIPVTGGNQCQIKFEDGTIFSLEHPVVIENIKYEILVPNGAELRLLSAPIDMDNSITKYAPANSRLKLAFELLL